MRIFLITNFFVMFGASTLFSQDAMRAGKKKGNGGNAKVKLQKKAAGKLALAKRAAEASAASAFAPAEEEPAVVARPPPMLPVVETEDFADFKVCMSGFCGDGRGRPPNVLCYYDEALANKAFAECKVHIADESRAKEYSAYFSGDFLFAEQKDWCNKKGGLWDTARAACAIKITFKRYADRPSGGSGVKIAANVGCEDNESKTLYLGERGFVCLASVFGKEDCMEDRDGEAAAAKNNFKTNLASTLGGAAIGALGGFFGAASGSTTGQKIGGAFVGAASDGLAGGIGLMASSYEVRGSPVYGKCYYPDGEFVNEGGTVSLEW